MVTLFLFVLPLGLDTFAVAAALGMRGLPARRRLRVSLLMSAFEMGMPVVGLLLGRSRGNAIGHLSRRDGSNGEPKTSRRKCYLSGSSRPGVRSCSPPAKSQRRARREQAVFPPR